MGNGHICKDKLYSSKGWPFKLVWVAWRISAGEQSYSYRICKRFFLFCKCTVELFIFDVENMHIKINGPGRWFSDTFRSVWILLLLQTPASTRKHLMVCF